MGKTFLVPVIVRKAKTKEYVAPWSTKKGVQRPADGKPTSANLAKFRDVYNAALLKGGSCEHIGINGWLQCRLEIYSQKTGEVLAEYSAPMFETIPNCTRDERMQEIMSTKY